MALTKVIGSGIGTVTNQFSDANIPAGNVLQVTYATLNTNTATSSTSYATTAIKTNITPKFSTSKILIQVQVNGIYAVERTTSTGLAIYKGIEGSTMSSLKEFDNVTGYTHSSDHGVYGESIAYNFLMSDAIGNTNNNRFEIYFKRIAGSGTIYINNYAANTYTNSSITLLEVAV